MHNHHNDHRIVATAEHFPTEVAGLPASRPTKVVDLPAGEQFDLHIAPVAKRLGEDTIRMLAYNGSIPGPTLRVQQGTQVKVDVANAADLETTVHWHGLRLDNANDGTHETQRPFEAGETFTYNLEFPDPGVYWYHPHVRQDYAGEMGLYGNILVVPNDPDYWPPAHRELLLTLDDILLEDGKPAPFNRSQTTHVAMGRFGNRMLINGEPCSELEARLGEVVRFYLTNTANTRVFRVAFDGARMKLVGGDSGRYESEQFVDTVVLAPSERAVVDVLFHKSGRAYLEHRHPGRSYRLADVNVDGNETAQPLGQPFDVLRVNADMSAERRRIASFHHATPNKTIAFVAEMDMDEPDGTTTYVCPMHSDIVSAVSASCPKCGMKLLPSQLADHSPHNGKTHHGHVQSHERLPDQRDANLAHQGASDSDGIEWEDEMTDINVITTPENTKWKLVDRATDAENHDIDWHFKVGDQVKIRLLNEMESDHPMHHPFHVHGAGRFLILSRDGAIEPNLVWKDTVLVRAGETVDILLDVTNPGRWMAHCHIAEHHESGMTLSFNVTA